MGTRSSIKLFSLLSEEYSMWMLEHCQVRTLHTGDVLVHKGVVDQNIKIIVQGYVGVYRVDIPDKVDADPTKKIASLIPGELLGVNSFLRDSKTKTAVVCESETSILELEEKLLHDKIASDKEFSHQFYKAIAIILSDQIKKHNRQYINFIKEQEVLESPSDDDKLITQFDALTLQLKQSVHSINNSPSHEIFCNVNNYETVSAALSKIMEFCQENYNEREISTPSQEIKFFDYAKRELLPYLVLSSCVSDYITKPMGYDNQ